MRKSPRLITKIKLWLNVKISHLLLFVETHSRKMATHTGNTPLTENANNNGEIFFNQPKSLKRFLDRYLRQRNALIATTIILFLICIVLLVCFIVLKRKEGITTEGLCNSLGCIATAAGKGNVFLDL